MKRVRVGSIPGTIQTVEALTIREAIEKAGLSTSGFTVKLNRVTVTDIDAPLMDGDKIILAKDVKGACTIEFTAEIHGEDRDTESLNLISDKIEISACIDLVLTQRGLSLCDLSSVTLNGKVVAEGKSYTEYGWNQIVRDGDLLSLKLKESKCEEDLSGDTNVSCDSICTNITGYKDENDKRACGTDIEISSDNIEIVLKCGTIIRASGAVAIIESN